MQTKEFAELALQELETRPFPLGKEGWRRFVVLVEVRVMRFIRQCHRDPWLTVGNGDLALAGRFSVLSGWRALFAENRGSDW